VFQRVELQQQSVIQTDEFHHLIVVQYIRLQYPLHGTVHAYRRDIEKVGYLPGIHPHIVTRGDNAVVFFYYDRVAPHTLSSFPLFE
jgi:hypothetical protein